MESLAVFPDGEWDSFNRMFFAEDQLDFTQQILHQFTFPLEHDGGLSFNNPSSFCQIPEANMSIAGVNESLLYSFNALDSNFHCNSLETYYLNGYNHIAAANDVTMSSDISMNIDGVSDKITNSFPPAFSNIAMEDTVDVIEDLSTECLGKLDVASHPSANVVLANELPVKRKFDALDLHAERDKINSISTENTEKRRRALKDAPKVHKNVQYSKTNRKNNLNGNEGECNIVLDGQSSSTTCSSEDDNVSQDTNGVATSVPKASQAVNLNGKTRASRGSATDPQSLYARKRRERINERLRILQKLVPNGTKVDISTMLEEAVHYVKFLQLQIKLLSSDDLWMYAPIAYNGIDIVLNKKISTLQ